VDNAYGVVHCSFNARRLGGKHACRLAIGAGIAGRNGQKEMRAGHVRVAIEPKELAGFRGVDVAQPTVGSEAGETG